MNLEKDLRDALRGMSAVTDIVGTRIWDEWFRTDTLPAIVFEVDLEERENDILGHGGMVFADINVICRADTRAASRELYAAIRTNGTEPGTGLAGYTGETFDSWVEDVSTAAVPRQEGSNAYWYDTNVSVRMCYTETV